ncbi:hemolysin activation/secretion protein [Methylophaga frappieri]|uniref:Hemolysin activation/secretion protein n=1 Tax=Methylophaga frappieri (strain ATCC BAA-2434 / DSM 25690 / JAM7) TaxID=754477 RepID=I1YEA5_METFJ|nr:ShlB/FhaC/HecB family hemolysin secretion/activation protein [Methylophaga frappieri]AFJ01248.1 hemolysin activation/secretion protein [Methylophaga frappieri]
MSAMVLMGGGQSVSANEPPLIVDEPFQKTPEISPSESELPSVPSESESVKTNAPAQVINDVNIIGGTVFDLETLSEWLQPIIGKTAQRDLLLQVVNKITTAYVQAGYPLSYAAIPPGQDLTKGRLSLVLVEGYLARSEIDVEEDHIQKRIERYVTQLMAEKPLTRKTFERYTALIESTPGYQFRIKVPRPQSASGATTIRVEQTKKKRYKTGVALDTAGDEPNRLLGSLTLNSMTSHADQLTLSGLIPNDTIDRFYSVNYAQHLNSHGLKLNMMMSHFKTDNDDRFFVSDIPVDFVENKTRNQFNIGLSYPIELQKKYSWWVGGKLHHLDEEADYDLNVASTTSEINKDLTYSSLEAFSNMQFNSPKSVTLWQFSVRQGVDLGANENRLIQAGSSRRGVEDLHFTTLSTTVFWRYRFAPKWQLQSRLHGHWSDDSLPSAEQARYGSTRYARGYSEGQAQGDRGYAGEVELRYLHNLNTRFLKQVQPYIILDTAHTELRSGGARRSLSSATVGIELSDNDHYGINLEYSLPTGDRPIDSDDRSAIFNLRFRWQL